MRGKYKDQELAPLLGGCVALLRPVEDGYVLAQFDSMLVQGVSRRPGEGFDEQIPYCFGWHRFHQFDFDIEPEV